MMRQRPVKPPPKEDAPPSLIPPNMAPMQPEKNDSPKDNKKANQQKGLETKHFAAPPPSVEVPASTAGSQSEPTKNKNKASKIEVPKVEEPALAPSPPQPPPPPQLLINPKLLPGPPADTSESKQSLAPTKPKQGQPGFFSAKKSGPEFSKPKQKAGTQHLTVQQPTKRNLLKENSKGKKPKAPASPRAAVIPTLSAAEMSRLNQKETMERLRIETECSKEIGDITSELLAEQHAIKEKERIKAEAAVARKKRFVEAFKEQKEKEAREAAEAEERRMKRKKGVVSIPVVSPNQLERRKKKTEQNPVTIDEAAKQLDANNEVSALKPNPRLLKPPDDATFLTSLAEDIEEIPLHNSSSSRIDTSTLAARVAQRLAQVSGPEPSTHPQKGLFETTSPAKPSYLLRKSQKIPMFDDAASSLAETKAAAEQKLNNIRVRMQQVEAEFGPRAAAAAVNPTIPLRLPSLNNTNSATWYFGTTGGTMSTLASTISLDLAAVPKPVPVGGHVPANDGIFGVPPPLGHNIPPSAAALQIAPPPIVPRFPVSSGAATEYEKLIQQRNEILADYAAARAEYERERHEALLKHATQAAKLQQYQQDAQRLEVLERVRQRSMINEIMDGHRQAIAGKLKCDKDILLGKKSVLDRIAEKDAALEAQEMREREELLRQYKQSKLLWVPKHKSDDGTNYEPADVPNNVEFWQNIHAREKELAKQKKQEEMKRQEAFTLAQQEWAANRSELKVTSIYQKVAALDRKNKESQLLSAREAYQRRQAQLGYASEIHPPKTSRI